mgnify:CR=1 FL=1
MKKPRILDILIVMILSLLLMIKPVSAANYLYVAEDGAGISCSQSQPCKIQQAVSNAIDGDYIWVKSGTYNALYPADNEVLYINKDIQFYGSCMWDEDTFFGCGSDYPPSTLDGESQHRVVTIQGTSSHRLHVLFRHFNFINGNATGYNTGACSTLSGTQTLGCGGGIYADKIDYLKIELSQLSYNYASSTSGTSDSSYGGGIYIQDADQVWILNNDFIGNTAGLHGEGYGGGLFAQNINVVLQIMENNFQANVCSTDNSSGHGCGLMSNQSITRIVNNTFDANNPYGTLAIKGSAVYSSHNTFLWLENNSFNNQHGQSALGVIHQNTDQTDWIQQNRFWNNAVLDNIEYEGTYIVRIRNNFIGHTSTREFEKQERGGAETGIRLTGTGPSQSRAYIDFNSLAFLDYAMMIGNNTNSQVRNNIIAYNYAKGIDIFGTINVTYSVDTNLFWCNSNNGYVGTNPVYGNPAFVNYSIGDFHITSASEAIDKTNENYGIIDDIDDELRNIGERPNHYDLGADEFMINGFLPIIFR